jgi:hypothetical protein
MSTTPLGSRTLTVKIGTVSRTADVSNCRIVSKPTSSKFTSFADAAGGGARDYTLEFTATQDPGDATSLWNLMFSSPGSTAAVEIFPYGGTTASPTNPKITGQVIVTEPDGDMLGGEADSDTSARWTNDFVWKFLAKPAKVTS